MPTELRADFARKYQPSIETVLENAYKKPFPNSYFAAYSRFLSDHLAHPYAQRLIADGFGLFLDRYVRKFTDYARYSVHFTGSIAFHYQDLLRQAIAERQMTMGNIIDNPVEGLVRYHQGGGK